MGGEDEIAITEAVVLPGFEGFEIVHAVIEGLQRVIEDRHVVIEIPGNVAVVPAVTTLVLMGVMSAITTEEELPLVAKAAPACHELSDLE